MKSDSALRNALSISRPSSLVDRRSNQLGFLEARNRLLFESLESALNFMGWPSMKMLFLMVFLLLKFQRVEIQMQQEH